MAHQEKLQHTSKMNISLPAPTSRREREEAGKAAAEGRRCLTCPNCWDTGHRMGYPIGPWYGSLAWQLARVPVEEIRWCDCPTGEERRQLYVTGLSGVMERRTVAAFEAAGIPPRFADLTFESIPAGHRGGKEMALAAGRMFAHLGYTLPAKVKHYGHNLTHNDKRQKPGLCFIGKPGVGKTGILSVAFRDCVAGGQSGLWIELFQFFREVQSQYGKEDGCADEKIRAACEIPLLFLDDCGDPDRVDKEGVLMAETDDKRSLLWQVLDYRHGAGLPTLITSNLSRTNFERQWGTRLAARVWEMCWVVPVGGIDLREIGP